MITDRKLPPDFIRQLEILEKSYLAEDDPIRQSGFGGGPQRWRAEREPILEAVVSDGELLDVGCANGYLLECLMRWANEIGIKLTPFGVDWGAKLIERARNRLPEFRDNFFVGNAWDWTPRKMFGYVYSLYDCVPLEYLEEYVHRLLNRMVAPGGRLILGAYGSRSGRMPPFGITAFLKSKDFIVAGTAQGGNPPIAKFAWIDR
jgi:SAM-dependent methyltransferase